MKRFNFIYSDAGRHLSLIHCKERNDCTVRSLTLVSERSYDDVYFFLKVCGRQRNDGMHGEDFQKALALTDSFTKTSCRTVPERFCYEHPEGRFILNMAGHYSACIDGVIHDTNSHFGKLVYSYYKFNPK